MSYRNHKLKLIDKSIETEHISIYYPELKLRRKKNQHKLNNCIISILNQCIEDQTAKFNEKTKLYGEYKIILSKRNLISIIFELYFFNEENNSNFDILKSIILNPRNGQIYSLEDLFYKNSNFENRLNDLILIDIRDNNIPIIQEFARIDKFKNFYLTETSLIIYLNIFKDSQYAGVYCTPKFTIPFESIKDIVDIKGPIGKLLKNNIINI